MKRSLILLAVLAAAPFAASAADDLSYTYVEGGYTKLNGDFDGDGWSLKGSAALAPNFHLFGGYSRIDFDSIAGVTPKAELWEAGVGYNHAIAASTDFVGTLAYQHGTAKAAGISSSTDGYAAEAGVRSKLASNVEGYAMAGYQDAKDADGDFYGRLGAQVKFNRNWGVSADVKFADGDTQWFVGPRLSW